MGSPEAVEAAIAGPMQLSPAKEGTPAGADAQEFVDAAREFLLAKYGEAQLDRLGATVITTVDLQVQAQARFGLFEGLVALDKRQGYGHKIKPVKPKASRFRSAETFLVGIGLKARPAGGRESS